MTVRPLTYDVEPRRRRWSGKWLVILGLLTAALAGWRWWPMVWWRSVATFRGYRATHIVLPVDQLAVTTPDKIKLPTPIDWQRFHQSFEGTSTRDASILFLQWRTAPNGLERFVKVGYPAGKWYPTAPLTWESHDMHGWRYDGSDFYCQVFIAIGDDGLPARSAEIFTGAADPSDDSHFQIRYRQSARDYFIDGYLMNDGTVRLESRPSPFSGRPAGAPVGQLPLRGDR